MLNRKYYKMAFTLAEVLLVLAVIGIVAALTIPTLIQKTGNDQIVAKLKKEYSSISQAYQLIANENSGSIESSSIFIGNLSTANSWSALNAFSSKMNMIKNCGDASGCFNPAVVYRNLDGTNWGELDTPGWGFAKAVLSDGSYIYMYDWDGNCNAAAGSGPLTASSCGVFVVDVNGKTGPNQKGRDVFSFHITKNGIIPAGSNSDSNNCTSDGLGCTEKVLREGNITY